MGVNNSVTPTTFERTGLEEAPQGGEPDLFRRSSTSMRSPPTSKAEKDLRQRQKEEWLWKKSPICKTHPSVCLEFIKDKHKVQIIKHMVRLIRGLYNKPHEDLKESSKITPSTVTQSTHMTLNRSGWTEKKERQRKRSIQEISRFLKSKNGDRPL